MGAFVCSLRGALAAGLAALGLVRPALAEPEATLTCLLVDTATLPSEELASQSSGRESVARVTWLRRDPGFLTGVESSAQLRLDLQLDALRDDEAPELRDASSWLKLELRAGESTKVSLQAFPFDTDGERLGYLHGLDWGGSDAAHGESIFVAQAGTVPGLELGFRAAQVELRAGLRWARSRPGFAGPQRLWGGLLRGSLTLASRLRSDFGLGYFERDVETAGAGVVHGGSWRWVLHTPGLREPELAAEPFRPPALRASDELLGVAETAGAAVAVETVALATRLRRFEQPASSTLALAPAAALYGSVRGDALAAHLALSWRSLAFVQRNGSGLMRGETAPVGAVERPELAAWVGVGVRAPAGLVPSLQAGVLLPAALEMASSLPGFGQSFVVREGGAVVALPVGSARLPLMAARAALRFRASRSLSLAVWLDFERDPNRVRFQGASGGARRVFAEANRFALGAGMRAAL